MKKNEIFPVEITDQNNLGYGVGRFGGLVVFVSGGVCGDRVRARAIKVQKDYAVARIEEVLTASPRRVESICDAFPRCGGCAFLNTERGLERDLKETFVRTALQKARVTCEVLPLLSPNESDCHRNKAQYPLFLGTDGKIHVGFFRAHSHDCVDASHCPMLPDEFAPLCEYFCDFFTQSNFSVYDEHTQTGLLRHLILRRAGEAGDLSCGIVGNGKAPVALFDIADEALRRFPNLRGVFYDRNETHGNVILGGRQKTLAGDPVLTETLLSKTFSFGPSSFFQTNHAGAELLFSEAKKMLPAESGKTVLDLYCGVGAVGQCIADSASKLIGVESVPEAVRYARENAEKNGLPAEYICADATDYYREHRDFDTVLLDPPRGGLSPELCSLLHEALPEHILYISCNPVTLARDLALLCADGAYTLSPIRPIDMFPRTGHVECVLVLSRT